ncbi:hypothetical protein F2P79_006184 [Pimephales promelas]|nr:hypothetical protein F2P79_006184 [Pimephales promelas]
MSSQTECPDSTERLADVGNWRAPAAKYREGIFPCTTKNFASSTLQPTAKSTATDSELHTPQRLFSEPRPILHSVFAFVHVLAASAHTTAGTTGLHILIHTPLQLGSPSPPPSPASDTLNRALHQTPYTHPTSSYSKVTPPDNNDGLCALQPFPGILQRTNNGAVLRNPTQQNSTEADVEMTARNWLRLRRDRKQEGEHLKVK